VTLRLLLALSSPLLALPASAADPLGADPMAQDDPGVIPGVPPGTPPPPELVNGLSYEIGSKIRCPVCQGLSVADSSSPAAVQMQRRIRDLVAAGYGEDDIVDFFVERYGEFLLLEPKQNDGRNLVIWAGPGLVLGLGLALALRTVFAWRKKPDDVPLPSDTGHAAKDKYEQRLLAELED
jgi:cytochrome c-type biogenesis protein CcmH